MTVKVGTPVPMFRAKAYFDDKLIDFDSETLHGKWWVLFFYPADFTFVCPTELGQLADRYSEFSDMGVEILSISTDTVWVHKAWHEDSETINKINFPMLADPTGNISRNYNVYIDTEGVALRGTFIVDPDGILVAMEIHSDGIGRNADELIRKVQAAKFVRENGVVCPAGWQPGDSTIKPGLELVGKI